MSTLTKGKWVYNAQIQGDGRVTGFDIQQESYPNHFVCECVSEPDAKLIASAPELLAMLHRVVYLLNDPDADSFDANQLEREIEQLITKVTQ
jgi:hypothetical protein